jgi:kynureninase
LIYLDGNSLGQQPRATAARVQQVVQQEWGQGLIRSWNDAGWIHLAGQVGDRIARLIGADPGEVMVADATSVNLYKVLHVALSLQAAHQQHAQSAKPVILSQPDNFPTDLYMAQSLAAQFGVELELCEASKLAQRLQNRQAAPVAVLMLTQVNYRSGAVHDMAALNALAHATGALTVWDLAHSAGAVPVQLKADDAEYHADFAVGCGYKFLNGGPGAPGFVWVHPRWVNQVAQPLSGWLGHAAPFEFSTQYAPAPGIQRYVCGTPPVLSLAALACGVDTVLAAEPLGGLPALYAKAQALTQLFIDGVRQRCAGHGLQLLSPQQAQQRGCQVSFTAPEGAYAMVQALIERGVIGDFRAPDVLRFGFTPLTLRFVDVWDAVTHLAEVLDQGLWRQERFHRRQAVT